MPELAAIIHDLPSLVRSLPGAHRHFEIFHHYHEVQGLNEAFMSILKLFAIPALLAGSAVTLRAQGADVEVQLHDGRALSGELYAVQDSTLLVYSEDGEVPAEFASGVPGRFRIETRAVKRVVVLPKSAVLESMGVGALVGGGVGAVIGLASGDDPSGSWFRMSAGEKALIAGAALGAGGIVVGLVVGIVRSQGERVVDALPGGDLSALKPMARFRFGESAVPEKRK